jgi:prohibitin 2
MDPNKVQDLLGRLQKGGKGAGIGLGVLAAVGGLAYGLSQSFYTGGSAMSDN